MGTYSVRCRNVECRHRRISKIHPDEYYRVPQCPKCGSVKGWRIEQRQYSKRDRCYCSGYHYPHQKATSKFCDHHPLGYYWQALRAGVPEEDIPAEYRPQTEETRQTDECPF